MTAANGEILGFCPMRDGISVRSLLHLVAVGTSIAFLGVCFYGAAESVVPYPRVFTETFGAQGFQQHWKVAQNWRTHGLRWATGPSASGLEFEARTMGHWRSPDDRAVAVWPIAAEPFDLQFDLDLKEGRWQKYFEAGVAVVVAPRLPEDMSFDDVCLVFHVHYAGVAMAVWKGWFLHPDAVQLSSTTGGGDNLESVTWNMPHLRDVRLRCCIRREENHEIVFRVSSSLVPSTDWQNPWCEKRWKLPGDLTKTAFRNLVVQRVPVKQTHLGYPGFVLEGVLSRISGYPLSCGPRPVVQSAIEQFSPDHLHADVIINGLHLDQVAQVFVDGRSSVQWRTRNSTSLQIFGVPLSELSRQPVVVKTASGLTATLSGGISKGLSLDCMVPKVVSAAGGETVTVRGTGFHPGTEVWIGEQRCVQVRCLSSREIQAQVPPGSVGTVDVRLRDERQTFSNQAALSYAVHPTLLWSAEELPGLKAKYDLPELASLRQALQGGAKANDFMCQLLLCVMEHDEVYREMLLAHVREVCRARNMIDFGCMNWSLVACTYDGLFESLLPEDRDLMHDYLNAVLDSVRLAQNDWFMNPDPNPSNTVAVSNGNAGLAALAIRDSRPDAAHVVLQARHRLTQFIQKTVRSDGGSIEGTLYWDFALHYYCLFLDAFRRSGLAPEQHGMDGAAKEMPAYVRTMLAGDQKFLTFNDTQPWLTGASTMAFLHRDCQDPLCGWLVRYMVENRLASNAALVFLWSAPAMFKGEWQFPGVQRLSVLKELQCITMRSDTGFVPKAVAAMTGTAGRMSHHCQEDQGNFVYYFNGAPVVIDPGYYQPDARAHSVPQVQGWKQKRGLSSMLADYGQTDAMQWSVMNLSPTFVPTQPPEGIQQDRATIASLSVWRTVVLCGTEILVLDDISSTASVSPDAQLQLQLGARPLGNGPARWYVETASGAAVQFVTFGPEMKSPIVETRDFSGSWIFKQLQESGQLAWHTVRCNYATDSSRPLITIASPADALHSAPSVVVYSADMIEATFASGKTVRFLRTESRWKMDSSADQAGNLPRRPESQ